MPIDDHRRQCDKHHKDLYFGDEVRPGITTRLLMMEDTLKSLKYWTRTAVGILVGIFIVAVAHLVMK